MKGLREAGGEIEWFQGVEGAILRCCLRRGRKGLLV